MIQVFEAKNGSTEDIPGEIVAFGPGAPAYLVIDPNEGSAMGRAETENEIRRHYKTRANIIFVGVHKLKDGRIVSVGQIVDPLVANMGFTR